MAKDGGSERAAAAQLWRLVQAYALIRVFHESKEEDDMVERLSALEDETGQIRPTRADIEAVNRVYPKLVALADHWQPQ
jgi:hypothetical protein